MRGLQILYKISEQISRKKLHLKWENGQTRISRSDMFSASAGLVPGGENKQYGRAQVFYS